MRSVLLMLTGVLFSVMGSAYTLTKSYNVNSESGVPVEKVSTYSTSVEAFERVAVDLYEAAGLKDYQLSYAVFRLAMTGYIRLKSEGRLLNEDVLSIIDFSKPSREKRFYTIDLRTRKVLYHTYVSHGKNTGMDKAVSFSNTVNSNQSSLGFYITGETYYGSKGFSLRLDGMESGVNDNMRRRAVVIHDAEYVSEKWIKKYGRLGRSFGCPALPRELSAKIINDIKEKSVIFAYFGDTAYLTTSPYLKLVDEGLYASIETLRKS